jgi:hypothetical protein
VKRFILPCLLVLGGLVASCTETDDIAPPAILEGTFDLTRVDSFVFVTSTDRDELRVLELKEDAEERDFIRAPNLLRPLSIPVLDRPQALARDISYDRDTTASAEEDNTGTEVLGPYVYARSNGSEKISVVGATPNTLRALTTLTAAGPVTAFAGRGPTNSDNTSALYFATQEATGGRLWRVALAGPDSLNAETPLNILELTGGGGASLVPAGEAVTSLLVLPQAQGADRIVFSTRGAAGLTGQTFLLDIQATATSATATATPLTFGGPVRQLATHGALTVAQGQATPDDDYVLPAGRFVFGILDPAACSAEPECTGVLAVDLTTRQVALDRTGTRMLPIRDLGAGLPMGLTLAPNVDVNLQTGTTRTVRNVPLLGIVPLSDGYILFFNVLSSVDDPSNSALKRVVVDLRTFDVITQTATDDTLVDSSAILVKASGETANAGSIDVRAPPLDPSDPKSPRKPWRTEGATRDETYELVYEGVLPGVDGLAREVEEPARFTVPEASAANVQVGDRIVLLTAAQGTACPNDLEVSAVEPPAGGNVTLVTNTAITPACVGYPVFQVRASGGRPYVLYGPEGFLKRMGQNDSYEKFAPYFFHPEALDPQVELNSEGLPLAVRFKIIGNERLTRGDRILVTTLSRYQPFSTTIDTTQLGFGAYRVPGAVVQADVSNLDFAYIAYPSANGILQVNLETITADIPTSSGIRAFE